MSIWCRAASYPGGTSVLRGMIFGRMAGHEAVRLCADRQRR